MRLHGLNPLDNIVWLALSSANFPIVPRGHDLLLDVDVSRTCAILIL